MINADAQKGPYRLQQEVAEANEAIAPELSYNTKTPQGRMSDVLVVVMNCRSFENVAGNRAAGNINDCSVEPESTVLF
jgi:hypothetical protein